MSEDKATKQDYNAASIGVMKGLEAVRKRPGMYIGDTQDGAGLHHMLSEVVDNGIDEAGEGHASYVKVVLEKDHSVIVEDDGRGIPVDIHPTEGVPAIELVFMKLHAGGKFDSSSYKASGGLHGVGAAVVNALSEWVKVNVWREGVESTIGFSRGEITDKLKKVGPKTGHGTRVHFLSDVKIFGDLELDFNLIANRLREKACLNPGVKIILVDNRGEEPKELIFQYNEGVADYVRLIAGSAVPSLPCPVVRFEGSAPIIIRNPDGPDEESSSDVLLAFQWYNDSYTPRITCYTNNIAQPDGGTHLTGLKMAFLNTIKAYMQNNPDAVKKKKNTDLVSDDIFEGITAILAIRFPQPQFSSQTKEKLVSSDAQKAVYSVVSKAFSEWLDVNPALAKRLIQRIINAAEARLAAREAANRTRETEKKSPMDLLLISDKHKPCESKNPEECELFVVEGDSAGGTAKKGRDKKTQGILALRGKILNVLGRQRNKILKNTEICTIIDALGVGGLWNNFDINKLRYHKLILMTDADVDGAHIRALAMTFFHTEMRELIEHGHLYVAQPPLYAVNLGNNKFQYLLDDKSLHDMLDKRIVDRGYCLTWNDGEQLSGPETLNYLGGLRKFRERFIRITRRMGSGMEDIMDTLLMAGILTPGAMEPEVREGTIQFATSMLNQTSGVRYTLKVEENEAGPNLVLTWRRRGVNGTKSIPLDLIMSGPLYDLMQEEESSVSDYLLCSARLVSPNPDDETHVFKSILTVEEELMKLGSKGLKGNGIQRFKGLGEMNEEQLWETAMNPKTRNLIRVTLPDDIAAEETKSCFMSKKNARARIRAFEERFGGQAILASDDQEIIDDDDDDDDAPKSGGNDGED